eukprot:RCo046016
MWEWYSEAAAEWQRYGPVEQALLSIAVSRGLQSLFLVVCGQPAVVEFPQMSQVLVRTGLRCAVRQAGTEKSPTSPRGCARCQELVRLLDAAARAPGASPKKTTGSPAQQPQPQPQLCSFCSDRAVFAAKVFGGEELTDNEACPLLSRPGSPVAGGDRL